MISLLLGPLILGTRLKVFDVLYTLLIVAGVVLCISAGSSPERVFTLEDFLALPTDSSFVIFVVVVVSMLVALAVHVRVGEAGGRGARLSTGVGYPVIAGMLGGCTVVSAKLLSVAIKVGAPIITAVGAWRVIASSSHRRRRCCRRRCLTSPLLLPQARPLPERFYVRTFVCSL